VYLFRQLINRFIQRLYREDEWKKHAPGLVVKTFHHSRKKYDINSIQNLTIPILSEIDVIISSTTFKWPTSSEFRNNSFFLFVVDQLSFIFCCIVTQSCQFHRVIQDESHLYSGGSKVDNANRLTSPLRWGVTATPMTSSVKELANQLFLVEGSRIQTTITGGLRTEMKNFCSSPSEGTFNRLVDSLQSFMIRHMKSQQINGEFPIIGILYFHSPSCTEFRTLFLQYQDQKHCVYLHLLRQR